MNVVCLNVSDWISDWYLLIEIVFLIKVINRF